MSRFTLSAALLLAGSAALSGPALPAVSVASASSSTQVMYRAAGHLWLQPVAGGPARQVPTPWVFHIKYGYYADFLWSPDAQRVAVDDGKNRVAVITLATGRTTVLPIIRCTGTCLPPEYAWSPNARYLADLDSINGHQDSLRIWDSRTGTITTLLRGNLSTATGQPVWSHDSTRLALLRGATNEATNRYPEAISVALNGRVVGFGKSLFVSWSPDDRFVGVLSPNLCGANTCDENELVRPSGGGPAIVLKKHSENIFDAPVWAPEPHGYAFDRWLLDSSGRPIRTLAGPHERVVSWRADGSQVAVQTYYPYQGTPDVLYLSTPSGSRTQLHKDTRNSGCGACSKDVYDVIWGSANALAFTTPTYPDPKGITVYPKLYVWSGSGSPTHANLPKADFDNLLGFADSSSAVVVHAGTALYRYTLASHRVAAIARHLSSAYSAASLDPTSPGTRPPFDGT